MAFDLDGAIKAGGDYEGAARFLAEQYGYDYEGAIKAGGTAEGVARFLSTYEPEAKKAEPARTPKEKSALDEATDFITSGAPVRAIIDGVKGALFPEKKRSVMDGHEGGPSPSKAIEMRGGPFDADYVEGVRRKLETMPDESRARLQSKAEAGNQAVAKVISAQRRNIAANNAAPEPIRRSIGDAETRASGLMAQDNAPATIDDARSMVIGDVLSGAPTGSARGAKQEYRPELSDRLAWQLQDLGQSTREIPAAVLQGIGDIAQLVSGGHIGGDLSAAMRDAKSEIDSEKSMESQLKAAEFQRIMRDSVDPSAGLNFLLDNPGFAAQIAIPSVGSMALPLGSAAAAGRVAKALKYLDDLGDAARAKKLDDIRTAAVNVTAAAQNAGDSFTSTDGSLGDKYIAATIAGLGTYAVGKATGGGVEGALVRKAGDGRLGAVARYGIPTLKEGAQETGEGFSQSVGEQIGETGAVNPRKALNQGLVEGALGLGIGGGVTAARVALGGGQDGTIFESDQTRSAGLVPLIVPDAAGRSSDPVQVPEPRTPVNLTDVARRDMEFDQAVDARGQAAANPDRDAAVSDALSITEKRNSEPGESAMSAALKGVGVSLKLDPDSLTNPAVAEGDVQRVDPETGAAIGPFSNRESALIAIERAGLGGTHVAVPVDGGFVGRAVDPHMVAATGESKVASAPAETWTGRRGDGYATREDADRGLAGRQRERPDLDWSVEESSSGRFTVVGREKTSPASQNSAQAAETTSVASTPQPAPAAAPAASTTVSPSPDSPVTNNPNAAASDEELLSDAPAATPPPASSAPAKERILGVLRSSAPDLVPHVEEGSRNGRIVIGSQAEVEQALADNIGEPVEKVRASMAASEKKAGGAPAQGFYHDGKVYLIGDNISDDAVAGVVLHEATHGRQRAEIDSKVKALIDSRASPGHPPALRALLDRVAKRMKVEPEERRQSEALPYLIEEAASAARIPGSSVLDGKAMAAIDKISRRLGDLIREVVAKIRAWGLKRGMNLNPTVDDLVALGKMNLRDFAANGALDSGVGVQRSVKKPEGDRNYKLEVDRNDRATGRGALSIAEATAIRRDAAAAGVDAEKFIKEARRIKALYPTSAGWAPLKVIGLNIPKKGADEEAAGDTKITPKFETIAYGFNAPPGSSRAPAKIDEQWAQKLSARMALAIREIFSRAESGDKNALTIVQHQSWYRNMVTILRREFGGAGDALADLLGATSPNTPVMTNWRFAIEILQRFSRGEFDREMRVAEQWVLDGKNLRDLPGADRLRQVSGKLYGMNSTNSMIALLNLWRNIEPGSAPKARNFALNLIGQSQMATIDVWAARMLRRIANMADRGGFPRIPPVAEQGVTGNWNAQATKVTGEFGFGAHVMQMAVDELARHGITMTAPDLQAVAWFVEKELWTRENWTSKLGEGGSFEEEVEKSAPIRYTAGWTVAQYGDVPSNEKMSIAQARLMAVLRSDDTVLSARAMPTLGLYAGDSERSFDTELTVGPGFDPAPMFAEISAIAKENSQYDIFVSKVLADRDASPNARPGIEVYFKDEKSLAAAKPIMDEIVNGGVDGFTMVVDPRTQDSSIPGRTAGKFIGVRIQYIPEISMRWSDDNDPLRVAARTGDQETLSRILDDQYKKMAGVVRKLMLADTVAHAAVQWYDTVVAGKENYDEYAAGSKQADAQGTGSGVGFGRPLREVLARADSRLRGDRGQDGDGGVRDGDGGQAGPSFSRAAPGGAAARPEQSAGGPGRVGDAGARAGAEDARGWSKRDPQPGSVSVDGWHYSNSKLPILSGSKSGTGIKGAEAGRLATSADPRIKRRVYFYIRRGDGSAPPRESGLGTHRHEQRLGNLYDPDRGDARVPRGLPANGFESAVLDAGYDGYINPAFGMAVVLNADVPVRYAGTDTAEATPAEPPAQARLKKALLAREIDAAERATAGIPGARVRNGSLEIDAGSKDRVNAALRAEGLRLQFSRQRSPLGLYSALAEGVAGIKTGAAPAAGWRDAIKGLVNKGAVKADEVEWSGVNDWLEMQQGKVTKDDVVEYLRGNGVQVEETVLGDIKDFSALDDEQLRKEYVRIRGAAPEAYGEAMSREEILDELENALDEDLDDTKFGRYTLPGGTNYREVLLTLPTTAPDKRQYYRDEVEKAYLRGEMDKDAYEYYRQDPGAFFPSGFEPPNQDYKSAHWDQPNVLAHIRVNDRTDADGKRVLFVEELQSDWAQEGRKKGFARPVEELIAERDARSKALADELKAVKAELRSIPEDAPEAEISRGVKLLERELEIAKELRALSEAPRPIATGLPRAPFVEKTDAWLNLALKRVMKMAVDEGYDRVAFVNGEQSADRYDLSKSVDSIEYRQRTDGPNSGTGLLTAYDLRGNRVIRKPDVRPEDLPDIVGKEVADRLMQSAAPGYHQNTDKAFVLEGENLKVGGEGMKSFYDKIVPQAMSKLLSKVGGGKMGEVGVSGAGRVSQLDETTWENSESSFAYLTKQEAIAASLITQPGFTITDEMREKVGQGLPLFSRQRQTETPEFKRWFGDSKVVDENGQPLVVYHGSPERDFTVFDTEKINPNDPDGPFNGFFFSSSEQDADGAGRFPWGRPNAENPQTRAFYLAIQNPATRKQARAVAREIEDAYLRGEYPGARSLQDATREELQKRGYDGIVFEPYVSPSREVFETTGRVNLGKNGGELVLGENGGVVLYEGGDYITGYEDFDDALGFLRHGIFVAFRPEQIKSATGNNGQFDPTNPDIRFSRAARRIGLFQIDSDNYESSEDSAYRMERSAGIWIAYTPTESFQSAERSAASRWLTDRFNQDEATRGGADLIGEFPAEGVKRAVSVMKQLARTPGAFAVPTADAKDSDPFFIFSAMARPGVVVKDVIETPDTYRNGPPSYRIEYVIEDSGQGVFADLHPKLDQDGNAIPGQYYADTSSMKRTGLGAEFYQAAFTWAARTGNKLVPDDVLTWINTFRRTEQMLSAALRLGTTKYMRPHPDQRIYGWDDDPGTPADDDNNLARLLAASVRNLNENLTEASSMRYNIRSDTFSDARNGKPKSRSGVASILDSQNARDAGIGRSTLARALFIRSAMEGEGEIGGLAPRVLRDLLDGREDPGRDGDAARVDEGDPAGGDRGGSPLPRLKAPILYSRTPPLGGVPVSGVRFTLPAETKTQRARRKGQDSFLRMKVVQDAITGQGGTVTEKSNVYRNETLSYGRKQDLMDTYRKTLVKPLVEKAVKLGVTLDELALYAYAIHAPERNAAMQAKNPGLFSGSGMDDNAAQVIVDEVRNGPKAAEFDELHRDLMRMTRLVRQRMFDYGLITADQFNALDSMYQSYVPLRGFGEVVDDVIEAIDGPQDQKRPFAGRKVDVRGKPIIRALGRDSLAASIIENVIGDYERVIAKGEDNIVARSLLKLVKDNPDPGLWEINATTTQRSLDVNGIVQTQRVIDQGPDTIGVKVAGQQLFIKVRDPLLVRAVKATHRDDFSGSLAQLIHMTGIDAYAGWLRKTLTQWNPYFVYRNTARDFQTGLASVIDELGFEGANRFKSEYPKAYAAALRASTDRQGDSQWDAIYREYARAGGVTGAFHVRELTDIRGDIDALLSLAGNSNASLTSKLRSSALVRAPAHFVNLVDAIGSASENATRVAAYKVARDMGKSTAEAASIAKELTTNFNRKGEWGAALNGLYLFFNAGVQGSTRTVKALANKKVWYTMAAVTGLAVGLATWGADAGGEDDDGQKFWDKIPDYEKERNLIIMLPPGVDMVGAHKVGKLGRYIKIPAPYGFNIFPVLGYALADSGRHIATDGKEGLSVGRSAMRVASAAFGSFNPFGGSIDFAKPNEVALAALPTLADLPWQLYHEVNAWGRPVAPRQFDDTVPDSQRFSPRQAGGAAQKVADWAFRETAGREYLPTIDVTPGSIETLVNAAGGGLGQFVYDVAINVPTKLLGPGTSGLSASDRIDRMKARDIPFWRDMVGNIDATTDVMEASRLSAEAKSKAKVAKRMAEMGIKVDLDDPESKALLAMESAAKAYTKAATAEKKKEIALMTSDKSADEKYIERQAIELRQKELAQEFVTKWVKTKRGD